MGSGGSFISEQHTAQGSEEKKSVSGKEKLLFHFRGKKEKRKVIFFGFKRKKEKRKVFQRKVKSEKDNFSLKG